MNMGTGGYGRQRLRGTRRFRRRVVIAAEGTDSEPEYFDLLQGDNTVVQINCIRSGGSPKHILLKMSAYLK
jgi:hypothetical protein